MEYKIVYSARKTMAVYIRKNGEVEVRCPKFVSKSAIEKLIKDKQAWIDKTKAKILEMQETPKIKISNQDKQALIKRAKEELPEKISYYSKIMKVYPTELRICSARSFWGSCSSKNKLSFSWRLMLASQDTINYVVVHELAHIKEHNHSKKFWNEVEKVLPFFKECKLELKELQRKFE